MQRCISTVHTKTFQYTSGIGGFSAYPGIEQCILTLYYSTDCIDTKYFQFSYRRLAVGGLHARGELMRSSTTYIDFLVIGRLAIIQKHSWNVRVTLEYQDTLTREKDAEISLSQDCQSNFLVPGYCNIGYSVNVWIHIHVYTYSNNNPRKSWDFLEFLNGQQTLHDSTRYVWNQ